MILQIMLKKSLLVIALWFTSFCAFSLIFYSILPSADSLNEGPQSILGAVIAIFMSRFCLIGLAQNNCSYRYFGIAIPLQRNQVIPIAVAFLWSYLSALMQF